LEAAGPAVSNILGVLESWLSRNPWRKNFGPDQ